MDETILWVRAMLGRRGISLPEAEIADLVPIADSVREWSEMLRNALSDEDPVSVFDAPRAPHHPNDPRDGR